MFEAKDKRKARIAFFACLIPFVMFTIVTVRTIIIYSGEPKDMNSSNFDMKSHGTGGYVCSNVTQVYGHQEHTYTETTRDSKGRKTTYTYTDYYYYIPVSGKQGQTYYICAKYPKNQDLNLMEIVTKFNSTSDTGGLATTYSIYIDGTIGKLSSDIYNKMVQDFVDAGIFANQRQAKKYVLPYVIESAGKHSLPLNIGIVIGLFIGTVISGMYYRNAVKKSMIKVDDDVVSNSAAGVKIGSITVKPGQLDYINEYISQGRDDIVIKELQEKYGVDVVEARNIVNDWYAYYN